MSMRIHRELDRYNTKQGKKPSKFTLKMPIKRCLCDISYCFLPYQYRFSKFWRSGFFFYLLRRMQETLQLWTVFGRLQSLKNFRLSVNWRFSSLKKRQSVPYIVPWPQENEKYNKMKKRNFEHGAFVLGPSFEIALGLAATPPDQNPHRRGWTGEKSTHTKRYSQGYPGETSKLFPKKRRENHMLSV